MSERLTTTIKHFKDGVTSMGLTAARHSIESWKGELEGYDGPAFHAIATDLGHLHAELGKEQIDGKKLGKLLVKLGKETAKCSKNADGKTDQIGELGALLEKAGHELDTDSVKA